MKRGGVPTWLTVAEVVALVVNVVCGVLGFFVSWVFWLPAVALAVAVTYARIVARGSKD